MNLSTNLESEYKPPCKVLLLFRAIRPLCGGQNLNHLGLPRPREALCIMFRNILRTGGKAELLRFEAGD